MKLPDRELIVHHTGEGWRCPSCFRPATVFYGVPPNRRCWTCWTCAQRKPRP